MNCPTNCPPVVAAECATERQYDTDRVRVLMLDMAATMIGFVRELRKQSDSRVMMCRRLNTRGSAISKRTRDVMQCIRSGMFLIGKPQSMYAIKVQGAAKDLYRRYPVYGRKLLQQGIDRYRKEVAYIHTIDSALLTAPERLSEYWTDDELNLPS